LDVEYARSVEKTREGEVKKGDCGWERISRESGSRG